MILSKNIMIFTASNDFLFKKQQKLNKIDVKPQI